MEHSPRPPSMLRVRTLPLLLICLLLVALSGFSAYRVAQRLGIAELQATGLHRLDLYATSLEREIGKYAYLPGTLSLTPEVLDLLAGTGGDAATGRVNAYLEKLNERTGTLSIYVIDPRGKVLATSNWRRPDSFLGEDLSFRPYFRDALESGNGRFFGIGTTRGEPGYYLASALTGDSGTLGVAVIKVSLEQLERSWTTVEAPVLVADENGVVILSAVANWKFTTLRPLDESTRAAFDHTQQYNRRALQPLGIQAIEGYDHGARLVRIAASGPETVSVYPVTGRFLEQSRTLPGTSWTLTVLSHLEQVDDLAQSRAALVAIAAACLCLLGIILNERRRHLRDRLAAREALQKAHDELERKVEERTADLSTANQQLQDEVGERIRAERTLRAAQDELVQAGKLAVIGQLSTGIAHELNQPLAALRTLSANAERFLERGDVDTTRTNLGRIADLVDPHGPHYRPAAQLRPQIQRPVGSGTTLPRPRQRAGLARRPYPAQWRRHCAQLPCRRADRHVRRQPAGTGADQPDRQRPRRHGRPAPAAPGTGLGVRPRHGPPARSRSRPRPQRRSAGPAVRTLLHHQVGRRRPGPRPGHFGRHRP